MPHLVTMVRLARCHDDAQTCVQGVLLWRLQTQAILIRARSGQLGQVGALPCLNDSISAHRLLS